MNKLIKKAKKGFTIIEMVIVVTLIGIVSSVVYSSYSQYVGEARLAAAKAEVSEVVTAFEMRMVENQMGSISTAQTIGFTDYHSYAELIKIEDPAALYEDITGRSLGSNVTLKFTEEKYLEYSDNAVYLLFNLYTHEWEKESFL